MKNPNSNLHDEEHPWWNRPLWGDKTMLEKIFANAHESNQEKVPEQIINIHNQELQRLGELNVFLVKLEDDKFTSKEFLTLIKIKIAEKRGVDEYQKIKYSSKLLIVGLQVKNIFEIIEEIELHYRGLKQQELYNFISTLLAKNLTKTQYLNKIQKKITEKIYLSKSSKNRKNLLVSYRKGLENVSETYIALKLLKFLLSQNLNNKQFVKSIYGKAQELLPQIKSEEGQMALKRYVKALEKLAEQEMALKLFSLFKKYNLADYSILRYMSELKANLTYKDLNDLNYFVNIVNNNYEEFTKLGKIIEVPEYLDKAEIYARILQYICLVEKYQGAFDVFKTLVTILQEWQKRSAIINQIRNECIAKQYKIPPEFKQELPGIRIFNKYKPHLAYLSLK